MTYLTIEREKKHNSEVEEIMSWRVKLIRKVTRLTDLITFYPKLKGYYKEFLSEGSPLIFDVGCNRGQSIDFFLAINRNARIIAFEPNKKLYDTLVKKYALNKNIEILNFGVSDKKGKLIFNENIFDETSTFEALNSESKYLKKKAKILGVSTDEVVTNSYEVDVIDLHSFISERSIAHISVMKIDVEGHEYSCLKGLFLSESPSTRIDFLQLENHFDDMYNLAEDKQAMQSLLQEAKFELAYKVKNTLADYEELIYSKK